MSRGVGHTQRRVLLYLYRQGQGQEDSEEIPGTPLADLKRAIGADRSNARRAIRTLTDRRMIEEFTDEDGERRVRLSGGALLSLWLAGYGTDQPLTLEGVPSKPLDLDIFRYDEADGIPHESLETPCVYDDVFDSSVTDNVREPHGSAEPSWIRGHDLDLSVTDNAGNPMEDGKPHGANTAPHESALSDNPGNAMQTGESHANEARRADQPVSDNGGAQRVRELLDALEHGEEP